MSYLATHGRYLNENDRVLTDGLDYFNIVDYGAVDGAADNRAAFLATIAAALGAGGTGVGGIIWVPRGEWNCKVVPTLIPVIQIIGLASQRLIFAGEGSASHIMMSGDGGSGDRRLFDVKNSSLYVGFKNLRLDSTLINEDAQQHLIHWECAPAAVSDETGRGFIHDVEFGHTRGDCIRFLGIDTKRVNQVDVRRCMGRFGAALVRTRTFVSYQRSADGIVMDSCYCDGKNGSGSIDMEPTGTGSNDRLMFLNNYVVGLASFSGNGGDYEHRFSIIDGNTFRGAVDALDVENTIFSGNIVYNDIAISGVGSLSIFERIHNVTVSGNVLYDASGPATGTFTLSVFGHTVGQNHELVIRNNLIVNEVNAGAGAGVNMQYTNNSLVSDNLISVKAATSGSGIRYEVPSLVLGETQSNLIANGNMILGIGAATLVYGVTAGRGNFSVMNCLFRKVAAGVTVVGTRFGEYMTTQNVMLSDTYGIRLIDTSHVAIAGAGNSKGPTTYQVTADAEGLVTASNGSIALRSTGGAAGAVLKIKESAPTPSTGWVGR